MCLGGFDFPLCINTSLFTEVMVIILVVEVASSKDCNNLFFECHSTTLVCSQV